MPIVGYSAAQLTTAQWRLADGIIARETVLTTSPTPITDRALVPDEEAELTEAIAGGNELVALSPTAPTLTVLHAIRAAITDQRAHAPGADAMRGVAVALGALWAERARTASGWEWRVVQHEEDQWHCIVSNDRAYATDPFAYLYRLLIEPAERSDVTCILVYNMIEAGKLPPSAPNQYLWLS